MTNVIVIKADKTIEHRTVDNLKDMQEIVGGLIQPVDLTFGTMYVNEESWTTEGFNSIATDVCGLGGARHILLTGLIGDAFLIGPLKGESHTDVTPACVNAVQRVAREA